MSKIRLMSPAANGYVTNEYGRLEKPPQGWAFLPAGDAAMTRKVTGKGDCWRVQIQKGRRLQSLGIWAPMTHISAAQEEVNKMRADPNYERKKASALKSRNKKQANYTLEFEEAVSKYLNFHPTYKSYEKVMAKLVTEHAIPVGSGTVARTSMIPIEQRAAKAVIAWMRHKTTDYDQMKIARIKGKRRAIRRQLADNSVKVLVNYRKGNAIPEDCPLKLALALGDK